MVVIKPFQIALLFCLLVSSLSAQKEEEAKELVESLFSYYTQDGKHSAVTGGEGTEFLQVYSVATNATRQFSDHSYLLQIGLDVISSASTDRINYKLSSASRHDVHSSIAGGYEHQLKEKLKLGGKLLLSLESDYFSRGLEGWVNWLKADQSREWHFSSQFFWDDLRWGRFQPPYLIKARNLVYPIELRDSNWFDIYNRYSYNFKLSLRQDLNRRTTLALFPAYSFQYGLLSTPFHRVYFSDLSEARVENLPARKQQAAIGVQLNHFSGHRWVQRYFYQYYTDNWGLYSHTLKGQYIFKAGQKWQIGPYFRMVYQNGSRYFKPFAEHQKADEFYTSDYDLSDFWSYNPGISLQIRQSAQAESWTLTGSALRYSYYKRSDGLYAHSFSLYLKLAGKENSATQAKINL